MTLFNALINKSAADGEVNDLLHAVSSKESLKLLLEAKADINHRDSFYGETPLLHTLTHSPVPTPQHTVEFVKFMIENKADINISDRHGNTVFSYEQITENLELMKILLPVPVAPDVPKIV